MLSLKLFDGRTGGFIGSLKAQRFSWTDAINDVGSLSADVISERSFRLYADVLAVVDGDRIKHAGYLTQAAYNEERGLWSLTAGGALTILDKRLVLNYALKDTWQNGYVLVDEENPGIDWQLSFTGSYSDIISCLLTETLKWGELPIIPATLTGGNKERNYNSYDFATVADRIEDIGELEEGPETRFDAQLSASGTLAFYQVSSPDSDELVTNTWRWNALIPDSGVLISDIDVSGEYMCTQSFGSGGKDEDRLLVARSLATNLESEGWPVLQIANKDHSSVSEISTLLGYVRGDTASGDDTQRVHKLLVDGTKYDVRVGDWADVRWGTGNTDIYALKVIEISGSSDSCMLEIQCRERWAV